MAMTTTTVRLPSVQRTHQVGGVRLNASAVGCELRYANDYRKDISGLEVHQPASDGANAASIQVFTRKDGKP